jgi:integrase
VAATGGATSARIAHAVLRRALADAERAQIVPRNIARDARPPEHWRGVPAPWSLADGRGLPERLRADGHRDEALHTTAMTLGLRQGELLALVWSDVDLAACRLGSSSGRSAAGGPRRGLRGA